jgi:hypothetical protein
LAGSSNTLGDMRGGPSALQTHNPSDYEQRSLTPVGLMVPKSCHF